MNALKLLITVLALFFFSSCSDSAKNSPREEIPQKEITPVYQNPTEYYKSIFTPNGVKDLERRVFTGLTITEKLGHAYSYQLPSGKCVKVAYFPKDHPQLFTIETEIAAEEVSFEVWQDYERVRIKKIDYFALAYITAEGLAEIVEISEKGIFSVSYFDGKYKGDLAGKEFSSSNAAMQNEAEEAVRQFLEAKYKPLKEELQIADFYRIYRKALRKEK